MRVWFRASNTGFFRRQFPRYEFVKEVAYRVATNTDQSITFGVNRSYGVAPH